MGNPSSFTCTHSNMKYWIQYVRQGVQGSSTSVEYSFSAENHQSSFGDRAFEKMAPKLWNNLPQNIRSITDFDKFKSMLKTHLFDNY